MPSSSSRQQFLISAGRRKLLKPSEYFSEVQNIVSSTAKELIFFFFEARSYVSTTNVYVAKAALQFVSVNC